jgi:NUMOD3 motif
MIKIEEYILLSKDIRQAHLNLDEPCLERGGLKNGGLSSQCKALLAHILNTTIPSGYIIHACHACNNNKCSNPNHLYWGTAKENYKDRPNQKTIWEYKVEKYGIEEAHRLQRLNRSGQSVSKETRQKISDANKGKKLSDNQKKLIADKIKKLHADGRYKRDRIKQRGRRPVVPHKELIELVNTYGFKSGAEKLGISIPALKWRYRNAKKRLKT